MTKKAGGSGGAITPKIWVSEVDEATIALASIVRGGTLIVGMLGAEAPPTGLPQGAFFYCVPRLVGTAPEAVWEFGLCPVTSLAQHSASCQVVFSWFYIGWSLCSVPRYFFQSRDLLISCTIT